MVTYTWHILDWTDVLLNFPNKFWACVHLLSFLKNPDPYSEYGFVSRIRIRIRNTLRKWGALRWPIGGTRPDTTWPRWPLSVATRTAPDQPGSYPCLRYSIAEPVCFFNILHTISDWITNKKVPVGFRFFKQIFNHAHPPHLKINLFFKELFFYSCL